MGVRQTGVVRKIRTFSICVAIHTSATLQPHTSATSARVNGTSCEWAFGKYSLIAGLDYYVP